MIRVYQGKRRGLGESPTNEGYIQLGFDFRSYLKEFRQISPSALAVFLCIVLHSNEDGWSWPGMELIEKETGWRDDTISATVAKLCTATINGKRLLLAFQPVREDGTFGTYRYLTFPDDQECADFEGRPLSQKRKVEIGKTQIQPPPLEPEAVEPEAVEPGPASGGAKKNQSKEEPVYSDTEVLNGRVLENPLKPLSDREAGLIGRGFLNAKKEGDRVRTVEDAILAMRKSSMAIKAPSVAWTKPEFKKAVRKALDGGDTPETLAAKLETFVKRGRKARADSWGMISTEWMINIVEMPLEGREPNEGPPAAPPPLDLGEAPSAAFLAGPPPSPTNDPVGLARWLRGIADTRYDGNQQAAQTFYEHYVETQMSLTDGV